MRSKIELKFYEADKMTRIVFFIVDLRREGIAFHLELGEAEGTEPQDQGGRC